MILSTTGSVEGYRITQYMGLVSGTEVKGTGPIKDISRRIADIFGSKSAANERGIEETKMQALQKLFKNGQKAGADAVVGITVDIEVIPGGSGGLLVVTATGTAVKIEKIEDLQE